MATDTVTGAGVAGVWVSLRVDPATQTGRNKLNCVSIEAAFGRLCFL